MTIIAITANALQDTARRYPIDDHGKLRFQWAKAVNDTGAAGDDGSTATLFKLPPGRKRIIPWLSRFKASAFGASRVLKIGHRAYDARSEVGVAQELEDDDAFASAIDISSAAQAMFVSAATANFKFDIWSREEVEIFATVTGGTWPTDGTLEVALAYLYE